MLSHNQGYFGKCFLQYPCITGDIIIIQKGHTQRLFTFARLYGYQERWTRNAVEELIKERFLECLETPSTSDYTKNYKLSEAHTFRASPLSVLLVKNIVNHPIYLSFIGSELPFHKATAFESYREILKTLLETLDNAQFERVAVDLVADTDLSKIVAKYLYQAFSEEQPSENWLIDTCFANVYPAKMLSMTFA